MFSKLSCGWGEEDRSGDSQWQDLTVGSREAPWEPWLPKSIPQDPGANVWSQDYAVTTHSKNFVISLFSPKSPSVSSSKTVLSRYRLLPATTGSAKHGFSFGQNPDHVLLSCLPGFLLCWNTVWPGTLQTTGLFVSPATFAFSPLLQSDSKLYLSQPCRLSPFDHS